MTASDISAIIPLLIPAVTIIILLVCIAVSRCHSLGVILTAVSMAVSLIVIFFDYGQESREVTQLLIVDGYARFYTALIYAATLVVSVQSYGYLKHRNIVREEYYVLLLAAALGSAVLASANHFISLFVGIELLSLSLYVLIAYTGTKLNVEAGIKYFVMTAVSIAFLLFGTALIYGSGGTMKFLKLSEIGFGPYLLSPIFFAAGAVMVLTGLFFKLALVPFSFWAPDVFQGAPAPATGFLATVSKGAVFAVLMRYLSGLDIPGNNWLFFILAGIAVASMFFGNITALLQNNVKRVLAYSSIAHFGYLLLTVIAGGSIGVTASIFYLTAYFITTLTAFGVITFLSSGETDLEVIDDYRGLAFRHPVFAACLTAAMLSLAGIPLTAGFIAKFYIITAGAKFKLWALLVILIINSVIGLFYYLRIAAVLYGEPEEKMPENEGILFGPSFAWPGAAALVVLFLSLFFLGIWPGPVVQLILTMTNLST